MNIGGGDEYDGRTRTSDYAPGASEGSRTTTRTRLPGNEAGGSGGRPPTRPGRSLITVVAVVVLLIAAIAFANRGGGGGEGGGAASDDSRGGDSRAQPTAPTGEKPVKNSSDTTIPSGFAHTEQGAQSAAANYVVALGGEGMYTAAGREKIIDSVYAPSVANKRQADLGEAYGNPKFLEKVGLGKDGKAPKGSTFVARATPVGVKVIDYADDKAKVAVWYSTLFGLAGEGSKHPVAESWYTNTFDLAWNEGDWKVKDVKQKDGPTPIGKDQAASPAEEMADAVDGFGGFTYAR
ncbi:hypothetical protein MMF93_15565 [Streptomyces tubbatahanensis]|uniref:DUF8175 domain-containing protein n=1 Tax=Streptomyces tubbatahanensis TaxID=2923272 RepID=A0ABY3XTI4_9ACTN|nr:hypothetical protein [Streptomyces tubbatahanensis]UNS97744.1 hypothetical protein MMF93_15565 [Streptomyces tubbatahanensis]